MSKNLVRIINLLVIVLVVMAPNMYAQPGQAAPLESASGTWECWDDGNGNPCREDFYGLDFLSSSEGWAVGDSGLIQRFDGTKWADVASPITTTLYSVDMVSPALGWAAGSGGVVLQWNGTDWVQIASPAAASIYDVKMVSSTDGWAVGDDEAILHWDGTAWHEVAKPASTRLYALDIVNANDAWAVGDDGTSVLHWNGSQWLTVATPLTDTHTSLTDIDMLSASDGWAVGEDGAILRWDGSSWQLITSPSDRAWYEGISMVSATDGWIVTKDTFLRWNGSEWTDPDPYGHLYSSPARPRDIQMLTSSDGWIVSGLGEIWRWNGTVWQRQTRPSSNLYSVVMSGADNGFFVGGWPDYVAMRWDGQTWVNTAVPETSPLAAQSAMSPSTPEAINGGGMGETWFSDVDTLSSASAWAVGNSDQPMHWDGQRWITTTIPASDYLDLEGVDAISDSDVWAVGNYDDTNGNIFHWNGSTWGLSANLSTNGLSDIAMLNPSYGWAVGDNGTILHWNGSAWVNVSSPITATLNSVDVISSTFAIAVGYEGSVLRWDGVSWSTMASPTTSWIYSVDILSPTDIWIASSAEISHWDGSAWQKSSFFMASVFAINMVDAYEGWAVGRGGLVLHYTAPRPTITLNETTGAPGSYFTVTGTNFPANQLAHIFINGHELGTVLTDSSGSFVAILSTMGADSGRYNVTVNATADAWFLLNASQPVRPQDGSGTIIAVPSGIALRMIYLPWITR